MRSLKNMDSSQQIKTGAIISYISIGINILIGLIYTPWMIHSIGKENFGLYTLAMSVITFFVFDFGLSQAVQRFIAKYLAEGKSEKVSNCLGLVAKLYFWLDIALLILLTVIYFFISSIYKELTPDEIEKFKVIYYIASIFAVLSFPFIPLNGILGANEKFIQLKSCDLIHKLLIVGMMSVCLLFGYGLYALVTVNVVSGILTIVLKLIVLKRYTAIRINIQYKDKTEFKSIMSFSGWVTVIALSQRMIFNIAPTILGIFTGSAAIAVFGVASTIESYVFTFSSAINGLFMPKVARKVAAGEDLLPLMIKVGRIQLFVVTLVIFGFISIGKSFIHNWVGSSFSEAYYGATLLILPSLLHLPQEIADQALSVVGYVKQKAVAFVVMAVSNIIFAFILAPLYGMIGICIAISISYFVRTIVLDIIYNKKLKLRVISFLKESYLKMGIPLLFTLIFGISINYLIPLDGWFGIILKGLLFVAEYCFITWFLVMNNYEKDLIVGSLRDLKKIIKD